MRCEAWNRVRGQLVHCGREDAGDRCLNRNGWYCPADGAARAPRPLCNRCRRLLASLFAHSRPADDRHKGDTP